MALGVGSDLLDIDLVMRARSEGMGAFSDMESHLGAIGKGLAVVGTAAVGAGAVLVAAGATAVKMAADFQASMTQLVTGAGESQSNLQMVSDGILNMAGQVGESTTQLAQGMFMIESAGYHGAAGLQVLQAAAEGARVGNADLQTTADAVTTVMRDYHMSANQAADATNFLVAVVAQGKTHMQDLAGSLAAILPTASALGIPLDQMGGALATLTARGVPAADAATYLRFTLSSLAAETPKGKKALEDIGISANDLANILTTQGLQPALQDIEAHLKEKFPQGGAEMFATLKEITGGTRGLGAALGLTGQNLDDFVNATANVDTQMQNAHGHVEGWSLAQEDFNTKLDMAKGGLEAFAIKVGQMLMPAASAALGAFSAFAGVLTSDVLPAIQDHVIPAIQNVVGWIQKNLIPAAQDVVDWFGKHIVPVLQDVGGFIMQTVVPGIENLWSAFSKDLLPIIKDVAGWITDHLAPVLIDIGKHAFPVLIDIVSTAMGVVNGMFNAAVTLSNWVGQHWPEMIPVFALVAAAVAPLVAQFIAAQVMGVASAVASAAAWAIHGAEMIVGWSALGIAATASAIATGASWVASAVASSAAWVASKAVVIAQFVAMVVSAEAEGVAAYAPWLAAAIKTTAAWVATKVAVVASFVETVASAVEQAALAAAAWIANAAKAAAAWVGDFVVKMASAGSAVATAAGVDAGATSTAWTVAATESTTAWTGALATIGGAVASFAAAAAAALAPLIVAMQAIKNFQNDFKNSPLGQGTGSNPLPPPNNYRSDIPGPLGGATGGKYAGPYSTFLGHADTGGKYFSQGWIHVGEGSTNPEWVINAQQAGQFAPLLDALVFGGASAPSGGGASGGGMALSTLGGVSTGADSEDVLAELQQIRVLLTMIAGAPGVNASQAAMRVGA